MCAASISYSRHSSCTGPPARIAYAGDARGCLTSSRSVYSNTTYQQMLALFVLSLYETSQGNGAQAWHDLTTEISILSSLRHTISICPDDEIENGLEIIHIYLRGSLDSDHGYPMIDSASVSQILLKLSDLLHRCITFSRKDMTKLMPAPWARESPYMALKQELDVVHIIYGGNSALETETLEMLQKQETGAGYYVLYAMRILLDAVFLPVPVGSPTFTVLPPRFTVSHIDQTEYRIAPPFLGYTLFLTGLVFLNQLHAETDKRRLDDCVMHLKTIFSFLGAMRSFFAPAQVWLHVLFQVHGLDPVSESKALAGDPTKLFSSFMHKFDGVLAPAYCPVGFYDMTVLRQQSKVMDERILASSGGYSL
ncbi:hypothetical protein GGR54DRAFT_637379 [Hypoxylon sp. NC1633]|nr:hypothetical protein GGR54DRAFT_637379 [Hypoxylon sp. NC1633]